MQAGIAHIGPDADRHIGSITHLLSVNFERKVPEEFVFLACLRNFRFFLKSCRETWDANINWHRQLSAQG